MSEDIKNNLHPAFTRICKERGLEGVQLGDMKKFHGCIPVASANTVCLLILSFSISSSVKPRASSSPLNMNTKYFLPMSNCAILIPFSRFWTRVQSSFIAATLWSGVGRTSLWRSYCWWPILKMGYAVFAPNSVISVVLFSTGHWMLIAWLRHTLRYVDCGWNVWNSWKNPLRGSLWHQEAAFRHGRIYQSVMLAGCRFTMAKFLTIWGRHLLGYKLSRLVMIILSGTSRTALERILIPTGRMQLNITVRSCPLGGGGKMHQRSSSMKPLTGLICSIQPASFPLSDVKMKRHFFQVTLLLRVKKTAG